MTTPVTWKNTDSSASKWGIKPLHATMSKMSAIAPSPLPHWDLTAAFPSLDSPEFDREFKEVLSEVASFSEAVDEAEGDLRGELVQVFETLVAHYNNLFERIRTLSSFIEGFVSTDSRNELALKRESELEIGLIPFRKASTRFTAFLGRVPLEELLYESKVAREHEFCLQKAAIMARHLMEPQEEALAAELGVTAISAWERLHSNLTSQIEVDLEVHGKKQRLPMSMVRNLAYDSDREVRKTAYEAEIAAWKSNEVAIAACMNSIKGSVCTLTERRGWDSPLEQALFGANIDQVTLDAMMLAAQESFTDFRRYFKAKAKLLGLDKLAFCDIFAPVGRSEREWSFEEGADFVAKNFDSYSQKLGDYARRAFREQWIDAEPRAGKQGGAFCMFLVGDQSRILLNYKTAMSSVKTLAHELGHGYHSYCLASRTQLQRRTPMTLAETASIFCETIVHNAAIKEASDAEQLLILEGSIMDSCQVVVDISSRYHFEKAVFENRGDCELAASEFCGLMLEAQRATYGDGLDPNALHPYMWAAKPHYYAERSFYNFPYMYGLLFGLGLYSLYLQDPVPFVARYDDLLSSTGMADGATLAQQFGFDVRTPDFWRSSLDVIKRQIDRFESLASAH